MAEPNAGSLLLGLVFIAIVLVMEWSQKWLQDTREDLNKSFTGLFSYFRKVQANIIMLGLDGAGKTTILYKTKLNKGANTVFDRSVNMETLNPVRGLTCTVWDLPGHEGFRPLWRLYFPNIQGVFFVVDSADRERFPEARKQLMKVWNSEELRGVPVVVLANKQDLPGAASISEIGEKLKLTDQRDRKWHIQGTCGTSGEGVYEAMHEMATLVTDFKKTSAQRLRDLCQKKNTKKKHRNKRQ